MSIHITLVHVHVVYDTCICIDVCKDYIQYIHVYTM